MRSAAQRPPNSVGPCGRVVEGWMRENEVPVIQATSAVAVPVCVVHGAVLIEVTSKHAYTLRQAYPTTSNPRETRCPICLAETSIENGGI